MGLGRAVGGACCAAGIAFACVLTASALSAAAVTGEEERYIALPELVPSALPVGTRLVTDGEYAGRVEDNLALRGSSVLFVLDPKANVEVIFELLTEKSFLRVWGVTAYRESTNTHYVSVLRVESAKNLIERVMRALTDPRATPQTLYEIGRAARIWAQEHPDERMTQLADAAIAKALKMEDLALGPEDWQGYFALAQKAGELLGATALREFYVREGVRAFILSKGRRRAATYYEAAKKAEQLLPEGALAELLLEKGFAIETGRQDGAASTDYYALAAKALEIFGRGNRYYSLLGKGLAQEHAALPGDDYQSRYALARKARDIYPDYSGYGVVVTEAIIAEKAAMDLADPQAWNRLGERVLFFLDDRRQAAVYFKESFRLDPDNAEVAGNLRELGFFYYRGRWWRPEEFGRRELLERARELERLAAAGEVAVGMSRDQVLRALGEPDEVNATAGGWGRTTQWVWARGGVRTYVSFIADTVIAKGTVREDR